MEVVQASPSLIEQFVARARRRQIAVLLLEECCRAAAVLFLAVAVLLVSGADIFRPAWAVLAGLAAAGWCAWRVALRRPDPYTVAQRADAGLGLKDLLATAWYLRRAVGIRSTLAPLVQARAEHACQTADVRNAVPLQWTPAATAAAAALALALALFILRVGVLRTFDLRAPLVAVQFDTLTGAPLPPKPPPRAPARKLDLPGFRLEDNSPAEEQLPLPPEALRSIDSREPAAPSPESLRKTASGRSRSADEAAENADQAADAADSSDPNQDSGEGSANGNRQNSPPPQKQDSLLDKMRDALASLMDKFKLELPPGDGSRAAAQNSSRKDSTGREKSRPQPGKKGEPGQEGELQSGRQQAADSSQQAKSDQAGRPDASSQNEKSGVGREEGRKELELAEQLEAMGKLDELIGKRAQNVQGEIMVEVTHSKNQSLRTPFVQRTGNRTDSGSELNRDEVPLHLQPYVQRYYEQVRKAPATQKQE